MNSSFTTVAPLRHGLISCAACFPPGHEPGVTYEADGWRVDNNPGYWGAASPEVLVLGFSKGANQRGGMPFDRIAFNNARGNLKEILTTLGLVDAGDGATTENAVVAYLRREHPGHELLLMSLKWK